MSETVHHDQLGLRYRRILTFFKKHSKALMIAASSPRVLLRRSILGYPYGWNVVNNEFQAVSEVISDSNAVNHEA